MRAPRRSEVFTRNKRPGIAAACQWNKTAIERLDPDVHNKEQLQKQGCSKDGLIAYKTTEAAQRVDILKSELHKINEQIVALERRGTSEYREELQNLFDKKNEELAAHISNKPQEVVKPDNDPAVNKQISDASIEIEQLKQLLTDADADIRKATQRKGEIAQLVVIVDRLSARVDNLTRQVQTFFTESNDDFARVGIDPNDVVRLTADKTRLSSVRITLQTEQNEISLSLDPKHDGSLAQTRAGREARIRLLEDALDEPNRRYRAFETALATWETQRLSIVGTAETPESLTYLQTQIADLANVPQLLQTAGQQRLAKSKEIHAVIRELADTYRELYAPVNTFIKPTNHGFASS